MTFGSVALANYAAHRIYILWAVSLSRNPVYEYA